MKVRLSLSFKFGCEGVTDVPSDKLSKADLLIEEYKTDIKKFLIGEIAIGCDKAFISDFNVNVEPVEENKDAD